MGRLWRLFHEALPAETGAELSLSREESHHARRVLRLRAGDAVCLFDGRGLDWEGRLARIEGDEVRVVLTRPAPPSVDPALRLELHQGLCRADRMEWIVQKGTELGLAKVHCHPTRRADLRQAGPKLLGRWRRIAIEAAKQSGRSFIPEIVEGARALPEACDGVPSWIATLDGEAPGLGQACVEVRPISHARLAVGPESGFDPDEVDAACASGWRRVRLGPRTLRAETAAIAATTMVLAFLGEMERSPPD